LLVTLVTALIVSVLGCQLDESNLLPCPVLGVDIGTGLYLFGMFFWLGFFTLPIVAIGVLIWLGIRDRPGASLKSRHAAVAV
jgi:hypothetical protein